MKKILYVDMDNVLVDVQSAFSKLPKDILTEYDSLLNEILNIFLNESNAGSN